MYLEGFADKSSALVIRMQKKGDGWFNQGYAIR